MSRAEDPTRPDGPNSIAILREAIQLLEQVKQMAVRMAEQTQSTQNGNITFIRMLEDTQELVRHGITRAVGPLEDRVTLLEARVDALEKVA